MSTMPNVRKGAFITSRVPVDIDQMCSFREALAIADLIKFHDDERENPVEYFLDLTQGDRNRGMFVLSCPARRNVAGDILQFPLGLMIHDSQQDFRAWSEGVRKAIADHLLP